MASGQEAERLDEFADDGEGAWYFDLPQGAWERQEAKNRQLRQSVRQNMSSPGHDRFGAKRDDAEGTGWDLVRPGAGDDTDQASRFPFDPLVDPAPRVTPPASWAGSLYAGAGEDEAEPEVAVDEAAPAGPETRETESGYDADEDPLAAMRRWAEAACAVPRGEPDEAVALREEMVAVPGAPWDDRTSDGAAAPTTDAEDDVAPRALPLRPGALAVPARPDPVSDAAPSRWDEMFAAPAGDGIVEGMREWAQRGPVTERPAEVPPEFLQPFDWELEEGDARDLAPALGAAPAWTVPPLPGAEEDDGPAPSGFPPGVLAAETDTTAMEYDWPAPEAAPVPEARPGLFARLFGRGKHHEVDPPLPAGDWVAADGPDGAAEPVAGPAVAAVESDPWPDEGSAEWPPAVDFDGLVEASGERPQPARTTVAGDADASGTGLAAAAWENPLTALTRTEPAIANNGGMPASPDNLPPDPLQPPGNAGDDASGDPWAAFLAARDADDGEVTAPSPFDGGPAGADSTGPIEVPVASGMEDFEVERPRGEDTGAAEAGGPAGEGGPMPSDDPWAALEGRLAADPAEDGGDDGAAVVHSPAPSGEPEAAAAGGVPAPLDEGGPGQPLPSPGAVAASRPAAEAGGPAADGSVASSAPEEDPWDHVTAASGFDDEGHVPGVFRRVGAHRTAGPGPAASNGAPGPSEPVEDGPEQWQGPAAPADDVVGQAFEAHVASVDPAFDDRPTAQPDEDDGLGFEPLLGPGGEELMDEVSSPPIAHPSIGRLQGWAPQRPAASPDGAPLPVARAGVPAFEDRWEAEDDLADVPPWGQIGLGDEVQPVAAAVPEAPRTQGRTVIREVVETGLLALLVFLAVRASFQNFKVDGTSMYPTLEDGQFLIVNKLVYSEIDTERLSKLLPFLDPGDTGKRNVFHGPERGDIVVLRDPRNPSTDLIKRVIGLPGETVEIVDGVVYINDHRLEEPYITVRWHYTGPKILVEEGTYFVMGDNRENSLDSRAATVGLIDAEAIIGKAMLSYWPTERFGLAPNESPRLGDEKPAAAAQRSAD